MTSPDFESVPPFYTGYVNQMKDLDLFEAFRHSAKHSVLNLGFIIFEHEAHHRKILIDRYLKA
jgi:hypothetical protein